MCPSCRDPIKQANYQRFERVNSGESFAALSVLNNSRAVCRVSSRCPWLGPVSPGGKNVYDWLLINEAAGFNEPN